MRNKGNRQIGVISDKEYHGGADMQMRWMHRCCGCDAVYGAPKGTKALCNEGFRLVAQGLTARGKMIYSSYYESLGSHYEDERLALREFTLAL
jgi:hypothetical protein